MTKKHATLACFAFLTVLSCAISCRGEIVSLEMPRVNSSSAYRVTVEQKPEILQVFYMNQETRILPGGEITVAYELFDESLSKLSQFVRRYDRTGKPIEDANTIQAAAADGMFSDQSLFWREEWWVGKQSKTDVNTVNAGIQTRGATNLSLVAYAPGEATFSLSGNAQSEPDSKQRIANPATDFKLETLTTGTVKIDPRTLQIIQSRVEIRAHGTMILANLPDPAPKNVDSVTTITIEIK